MGAILAAILPIRLIPPVMTRITKNVNKIPVIKFEKNPVCTWLGTRMISLIAWVSWFA